MESGFGGKVKAANPPTPFLKGTFSRRVGALMKRGWIRKMKIILFPVNIDKFTGFFDKFLKNDGQIKHCNKKDYHTNLSVSHSDSAAKKVFRLTRICPQVPAFGRGRPGEFGPERTRHEVAHGVSAGPVGLLFLIDPAAGAHNPDRHRGRLGTRTDERRRFSATTNSSPCCPRAESRSRLRASPTTSSTKAIEAKAVSLNLLRIPAHIFLQSLVPGGLPPQGFPRRSLKWPEHTTPCSMTCNKSTHSRGRKWLHVWVVRILSALCLCFYALLSAEKSLSVCPIFSSPRSPLQSRRNSRGRSGSQSPGGRP